MGLREQMRVQVLYATTKKMEKIQENKNPKFCLRLERASQHTMLPIKHPSGDYTFQA